MTRPIFKLSSKLARKPVPDEPDISAISIAIGAQSLSQWQEFETGNVRDHFLGSATTLGLWLVENWWRLRWEPIRDYRSRSAEWQLHHELSSASGGQLWPPLMIYGVGARVVLAPVSSGATQLGPLRYLAPLPTVIPGDAFEQGIDQFLDAAISGLGTASDADVLRRLWAQLQNERTEPDLAAWRRLEAMLGFDPDEAPDALMDRLAEFEPRLGEAAVEEAAVAAPGDSAATVLATSLEAVEASRVVVDLGAADEVSHSHVEFGDKTPWRLAEEAAWKIRELISHRDGPLLNRALGDLLRVSWASIAEADATARHGSYSARLNTRAGKSKISLSARSAHDRRFELARALGDAIWSREELFGPITRAKTDRQKFQRAFAQSLLCPFYDLRQHFDLDAVTEDDISRAARRYHVHTRVIRTLLVNKGVLPRETLEERLEAA